MKYEVIKCDICGKDKLLLDKEALHLSIPYHRGWDGVENSTDYEYYDLCLNCIDNFLNYKLFKKNSFEENKKLIEKLEELKRATKVG